MTYLTLFFKLEIEIWHVWRVDLLDTKQSSWTVCRGPGGEKRSSWVFFVHLSLEGCFPSPTSSCSSPHLADYLLCRCIESNLISKYIALFIEATHVNLYSYDILWLSQCLKKVWLLKIESGYLVALVSYRIIFFPHTTCQSALLLSCFIFLSLE